MNDDFVAVEHPIKEKRDQKSLARQTPAAEPLDSNTYNYELVNPADSKWKCMECGKLALQCKRAKSTKDIYCLNCGPNTQMYELCISAMKAVASVSVTCNVCHEDFAFKDFTNHKSSYQCNPIPIRAAYMALKKKHNKLQQKCKLLQQQTKSQTRSVQNIGFRYSDIWILNPSHKSYENTLYYDFDRLFLQ